MRQWRPQGSWVVIGTAGWALAAVVSVVMARSGSMEDSLRPLPATAAYYTL